MSSTLNQPQFLVNESDDVSEAQENQPNYFDTLPDEIHLEILKKVPQSRLDSLALVSRQFYHIIPDRSLWKKVEVLGPRELKPGHIKKLMRRPVQYLSLSYVTIPLLWSVLEATQSSWCLKEVCFKDVNIHACDLAKIFHECKQLTKVDLELINVDNFVLMALSGNKNIQILRLSYLRMLTSVGLKIILRKVRKLQELSINFHGSMILFYNSFINSICKNLPPSLLHLSLCYCSDSLTDRHIAQIVTKCPLLRSLHVFPGIALTARSTESLSNLNHLRILYMPNCPLIPPEAYVPLTNEMENLVELNVQEYLGDYLERMRQIEELLSVNIIEDHGCSRVGTFKTRSGVVRLTY